MQTTLLNSGVTRVTFMKFAHNVARSSHSQIYFLIQKWRHSKPFWNAKTTNKNESADFAHFDSNIGCHDNVL